MVLDFFAVVRNACLALHACLQACCVLPTVFPVNVLNLNWAPVTAGLVLLNSLVVWFFLVIGAGVWYRGKAHTLQDVNVVRVLSLPLLSISHAL